MLSTSVVTTATLLTTIGWLPTGLRWNPGEFPIPYCVSANATRTSLNSTQVRNAVLTGINRWVSTGVTNGQLSCTNYRAAAATFNCSVGINTSDRRPNIFFESNWSSGSQTIGITWSTGQGSGCGSVTDDTGTNHNLQCKFDSDIEFNDVHYTWTDSGGGTDIASITAHEYGHFIGLDHCNDNGTCNSGQAVMYAAYIGGQVSVLRNDDVQGGCGLYPGTPGGLGWPCTANGQCTSNICVDPGPDGYCSQTCGTCPQGYTCGNVNNPNVCVRDDGRNRDTCEVCQGGIPDACANGGLCVGGIPEPQGGRCVAPCAAGGTCGPLYRCVGVNGQNGQPLGDFCYPRSSDCTDLNNINELQLGQRCDGDPPCADPLTCVSNGNDGICSSDCSGGGTCPTGFACREFQGGEGFCLPRVTEGQDCSDIFVACGVGPCLRNPANQQFTCYLDCAGNPGACNNAQMCNTYQLQGGGSVSICEPPGVPPNPRDAGVNPRDGGPGNPRDGGSGVDPRDGGSTITPPRDAGMSVIVDPNQCACDVTYFCDADPSAGGADCQCDVECPCECDLTFNCDTDPNASGGECLCDRECAGSARGDTCACTSTASSGGTAGLGAFGLLALFALFGRRRRPPIS